MSIFDIAMQETDTATANFRDTIFSDRGHFDCMLGIARVNRASLADTQDALEEYFYSLIEARDNPSDLASNFMMIGYNAIDWQYIAAYVLVDLSEQRG